jgi:DNA-binding NtrC family response regulator
VRIVSATNKDLRRATARGEFRSDLWYRLAGTLVEVPPLRERPEDVEAYLRRRERGRHGSLWHALTPGARALVAAHAWEGNFRELASFADQLRLEPGARAVDEAECASALGDVALTRAPSAPSTPQAAAGSLDIARLSAAAASAFAEDFDRALTSWDDVKQFVERYLKPLLFAHLSGAARLEDPARADIPALAQLLDADRGTAQKQLARFLERLAGSRCTS